MRVVAAAALLAALLATPVAAAEESGGLETRVFPVRWRSLSDAVLLARPPLVSGDAVIQMEPKLQTLTVTDWPRNLAALASALATFDVPPRAVDLNVKLLRGTSAPAARPIGDELRSIKDSVDPLVAYSSYEVIGEARLSGVEGGDVSAALGENDAYRVSFRVGAVDDHNAIVRLDDLSLNRRRRGPPAAGSPEYDNVMTLTYQLPSARSVVIGVTRAKARDSGVLLVMEAVIRPAAGASADVAGKASGEGGR